MDEWINIFYLFLYVYVCTCHICMYIYTMEYYLAMKKEILPHHGWTLSAYAKRHKSDRERQICMISLWMALKLAHSWPTMAHSSADDYHFEGLGLFSPTSFHIFFFLPSSLPLFFLAFLLSYFSVFTLLFFSLSI